ncbi:DUF3732 domain-containing protein [Streptomyces sp. NPDC048680]|uniref:DUF3732 domain-containing protein n=1 Tax=Streptomyces sp. NPDC048680 TaxID=3155492 RepID=UPI0034247F36
MQLLAIALYSRDGRQRVLDFKPGALNVVTGESATGKSALLDIIDYCTGRDTLQLPVGPITDTVSWYAALFQLDDTCAVVARPAPKPSGRSSQAMLTFGADLGIPDIDQLVVNTDTKTLRRHLGRRIGITENRRHRADDRTEVGAHLGHAMLLCLQGQTDIASKDGLFHRQGDPFVAKAIKATLPYFMGTAAFDQARKLTQLTTAHSHLESAEANYDRALLSSGTTEVTTQALWREAHALGMVPAEAPPSREAILETLAAAVSAPPKPRPSETQYEQRAAHLQRECDQLRESLRMLAADRQTLISGSTAADEFATSARIPRDRLASLNLLPPHRETPADRPRGDNPVCPLCGLTSPTSDPTVEELRHSLHLLSDQLDGVEAARPDRHAALEALSQRTTELRQDLLAAEKALKALTAGQEASSTLPLQAQADFVRGRIYGVLSTLRHTSETDVARLRRLRDSARARVQALEGELDPEREHDELRARLAPIGRDIADWSHQLKLEHGGTDTQLDPEDLTVTLGTASTRVPMSRIGSAANWIGYHVLAHLALHRYFVLHNRPVPRILVLDQPTQAWYLPDTTGDSSGANGADLAAVEQLFQLINDIVRDLAPHLQVIVCDHVNLPAPWFQQAVVQNWRGGHKLIPRDWIDLADQPVSSTTER